MNAPDTIREALRAHQAEALATDAVRCTCGQVMDRTYLPDHQALQVVQALMGLAPDDGDEEGPS